MAGIAVEGAWVRTRLLYVFPFAMCSSRFIRTRTSGGKPTHIISATPAADMNEPTPPARRFPLLTWFPPPTDPPFKSGLPPNASSVKRCTAAHLSGFQSRGNVVLGLESTSEEVCTYLQWCCTRCGEPQPTDLSLSKASSACLNCGFAVICKAASSKSAVSTWTTGPYSQIESLLT